MRLRAVALVMALVGALAMVAAAPAGAADAKPPTVALSNGIVKPGDTIVVSGENWPATSQAVITTCGNLSLNLSVDCDLRSQTSAVVGSDGKFRTRATIGKPETPCPCVVRVASSSTAAAITAGITLRGQRTATPTLNQQTRNATVGVKVDGGFSLTSLFGGAAKRTAVVTVTNIGNVPLPANGIRLTMGKGKDPTEIIPIPGQSGDIAPGQAKVIRADFTIDAPAFGSYTVKATVLDIVPQPVARATTTTYPWALFLLLWAVLQPLLLGLYKRRPVMVDGEEDPFAPGALAPVGAGPSAGWAAAAGAVGAVGAVGALGAVPAGMAATTAVVPRAPSALVPGYRPVFGAADLRHYLDPSANGSAPVIAPRIVLGGVVPHRDETAT